MIYTVALLLLIVLWIGGFLTAAAVGEMHDFICLAILWVLVRVILGKQSPA